MTDASVRAPREPRKTWWETRRFVFGIRNPFIFYRKWEGWPKAKWEIQLEAEEVEETERFRRQQERDLELPTVCALCGREPAGGWAFWGDDRLCHGDEKITCYVRWTVYGERPEVAS